MDYGFILFTHAFLFLLSTCTRRLLVSAGRRSMYLKAYITLLYISNMINIDNGREQLSKCMYMGRVPAPRNSLTRVVEFQDFLPSSVSFLHFFGSFFRWPRNYAYPLVNRIFCCPEKEIWPNFPINLDLFELRSQEGFF